MATSELQRGDLVDIAITGARLDEIEKNRMYFVMPTGTTVSVEMTNDPGVNLVCVSPVGWPPRKNDVWRDGGGEFLIGAVWAAEGPVLRSVDGSEYDTVRALALLAPLTLIVRDGQPFPAPAEQDDAPVDEIARALVTVAAAVLGRSTTWDTITDYEREQYRLIIGDLVDRYRITPRQQDGGTP
jgi:hypothetical protein